MIKVFSKSAAMALSITTILSGTLSTQWTTARASEVFPLGSNSALISERETKELTQLKADAKEHGFSVPSQQASRLLQLTLQTSLFTGTEWRAEDLEKSLQCSHEKMLSYAHNEWNQSSKAADGEFLGFKLIGVSKSGFKVKLHANATAEEIKHTHQALISKYVQGSHDGICSVMGRGVELRVICLNPVYQRTTEISIPEVKTMSTKVKGSITQAGGQVCTASGCGTFKGASVKQLDASSKSTKLTGKMIKEKQIRTYTDRADLPLYSEVNLEEILN